MNKTTVDRVNIQVSSSTNDRAGQLLSTTYVCSTTCIRESYYRCMAQAGHSGVLAIPGGLNAVEVPLFLIFHIEGSYLYP